MRKIPDKVKQNALNMWLEGYTYRAINRKLGVSTGEMSNIVAEARKRTPDLDQLRRINVMVMKEGVSVYDAVRGGRLLEEANRLGVSLDRLEEFLGLANTIASERKLGSSDFVESTLRLRSLEEETGKSYGQAVKDFEGKLSEASKLEAKISSIEGEIQKLMEARAQLEGEIREAKGRLNSTLQELNQAISTRERLQRIGLEKVSDIARFIEDFELLKFDVNVVRRLAEWRKSLAEMGIDPDGLERFVKERGTLEKQISELEKERRRVDGIVKKLGGEHRRLFRETTSLQAEVMKLSRLGKVVKLGKVVIPCKVCGAEAVFVKLHTASQYRAMMSSGGVLQYRCFNCGQWAAYSPWDILIEVGLLAAPEQIKEAQTPLFS